MKKTSKKIIFFGTDDFSLAALKALVENRYDIVAVITKPDSKSGRGQQICMPPVKVYAIKNNLTVWQPTKVDDINDRIKSTGQKITGVLSSYGKIIPQSTIDLFTPGIINIHPSLLPKYRGASPIESAIRNGDKKTGVSIMQLESDMDSGPIYTQSIHKLTGHETSLELYKTMASIGASMLINVLPSIIDGSIIPKAQDNKKATYCSLIKKKEAWLQPDSISAKQAESIVRAHIYFPKTKINILNNIIVIKKSHVSETQKSPLDIRCKDGKFLSIDELMASSGRIMSAQDFINGYIY